MIKSFRHKGIEKLFLEDDRSKVNQDHVLKLLRILDRLDASTCPQDMNLPGYRLHELKGKYKNYWSVWVTGNWRVIFQFQGQEAINVDYQDYH
ncbi:type II toxin-antitoxin system RelE/ParE family toxin [candidate division KSB1 bacterium]|nr:type II toxin-antitoxin system RelE/ParE family toxin [candidate division KSB1 bacterium]